MCLLVVLRGGGENHCHGAGGEAPVCVRTREPPRNFLQRLSPRKDSGAGVALVFLRQRPDFQEGRGLGGEAEDMLTHAARMPLGRGWSPGLQRACQGRHHDDDCGTGSRGAEGQPYAIRLHVNVCVPLTLDVCVVSVSPADAGTPGAPDRRPSLECAGPGQKPHVPTLRSDGRRAAPPPAARVGGCEPWPSPQGVQGRGGLREDPQLLSWHSAAEYVSR